MPVSKTDIIRKLNEYCFLNIWNEMHSEYRVNIELTLVNSYFNKGSVRFGNRSIPLPDHNQWLVLTTPIQLFFGGVPIPNERWFTGEEILNRYQALFYVYRRDGKLIPRSDISMIRLKNGRAIIAIRRRAVLKIFGTGPYIQNENPVYITLYRDSDISHRISAKSWYINPLDPLNSSAGLNEHLNQCIFLNEDGTTLLINGKEHEVNMNPVWNSGDFVEVVFDENIIGSYKVDVTTTGTGYFSIKDQENRQILHCPKDLNPNNQLITHNTCTLSVIDKVTGEGLYLHRCDDTSVGQITHNDISVSTNVVNAFRDHLGTENVYIKVRVRTHSKDNILMDNTAFIKELYLCSDEDIVRHLRGELDTKLTFWKASELEQHEYIKMMYDTPNNIDPEVMDMYVSALGYYTIASLIGGHIGRIVIQSSSHRTHRIRKPFALIGETIFPKVYIRGKKIRQNYITCYDDGSEYAVIVISDAVYLQAGDILNVSVIEDGSNIPIEFTPSVDNPNVIVSFSGISVYEEVQLTNPVTGYNAVSNYGYKKINPTPGTLMTYVTEDGDLEVVFGMSLYGKKLLICNDRFTWDKLVNANDLINDRGAIAVTLSTITSTGRTVPLLGHNTVDVYVNGNCLIPNVEYTAIATSTPSGHPGFTEVIISAMEYFSTEGNNRIEVIASTEKVIANEVGYVIDNKVSYNESIMIWYDSLSLPHVYGKYASNVGDQGLYLDLVDHVDNGRPYYLSTRIAAPVATALTGYTPNLEINRLKLINDYFGRFKPEMPNVTVVPASHRLYSPYVATIIRDIALGNLVVANDPVDAAFIRQFDNYSYLKKHDPTITRRTDDFNNLYLDVNPSYLIWTVDDVNTRKIIQRVIDVMLSDSTSDGEILDG